MKQIEHAVHLGYPGSTIDTSPQCWTLTVTPDELTLARRGSPTVVLTPDEVVDVRIDGRIPFVTQAIVVEHVAFEKIGSVFLDPVGTTCRKLLEEIKRIGFQPKAEPGVPWESGQPFPFEESEEEDAQPLP